MAWEMPSNVWTRLDTAPLGEQQQSQGHMDLGTMSGTGRGTVLQDAIAKGSGENTHPELIQSCRTLQ